MQLPIKLSSTFSNESLVTPSGITTSIFATQEIFNSKPFQMSHYPWQLLGGKDAEKRPPQSKCRNSWYALDVSLSKSTEK